MTRKKDLKEYVLVFPNSILKELGYFEGLYFDFNKYMNVIKSKHIFMIRKDAEIDFNYKQLIPYAVISHKNKFFSYRRGALLSEQRLIDNYSIGIGGHISANDPNLFSSTYDEAVEREVNEEIYIDTRYKKNVIALLNDDSNEVGKVHFGIIYIFTLKEPLVRRKEKSINEPKFLTIDQLKDNIEKYENWSKICIRNINKLMNIINRK